MVDQERSFAAATVARREFAENGHLRSVLSAVIYDPFLGSGTTVIAAEMTARRCVGLELSPTYVDVIVRRWQAFTGKEARLEATAETFAERSNAAAAAASAKP